MKREFVQNLRVGEQSLPKVVIDAIMEDNGRDIQSGKVWKEKYEQAVADHQAQLEKVRFEGILQQAITRAGGRNAKAITALLDPQALQAAPEAVDAALEKLKQECGYLFESRQVPGYAAGTGAWQAPTPVPETLAGALKERFSGR